MAIRTVGNGDYVTNSSTTLTNGLSALSMCAWIKSDITGTDKGVLIMAAPTGQDRLNSMRYDVNGFASGNTNCLKGGILLNPGGVEHSAESFGSLQTTNWQHIVLRWQSGTNINWIIDGAVASNAGGVTGGNTGTITGQTGIRVGQGPKGGVSDTWDGVIAEVRVYNRYISLAEAQTMHACKGADCILDGLLYHYRFEEGAEGVTIPATSGVIKSLSTNPVNLTRVNATATWESSLLMKRSVM